MIANLKRLTDWRTRMQNNLFDCTQKPFEWGYHDCAIFAASHVKALTDTDFSDSYRGTYSTALGSLKTLKENGYNNLLELCQDLFPEIHPSQARAGDLVVLQAEDTGYAIAIVLGETLGVLTPNGYGIIRRTDKRVVTGFKVG